MVIKTIRKAIIKLFNLTGLNCDEDNREHFAKCTEHADCRATICLDCDTVLDCENA